MSLTLRDEILEQPDAAQRLLDAAADFAPIADEIRRRRPTFALIAARGSSDNAALYAQYLFAIRNGLITALATPSTISLYGARPRMSDALVIGISQSGRSPDIVGVLEEARRQDAMTVAISNDASSPLADAAAHVIDLRAGPERATAATKTYSTELLAVALMSTAIDAADADEQRQLGRVPELMSAALRGEDEARAVASTHAERDSCIVLGRGYAYATAREWALKLQELAQVSALPFSAADFEHGPLALAEPGLSVLACAPHGLALDAQMELLKRLHRDHGARLLVLSDSEEARSIDQGLRIPGSVPSWLSPIIEILPAQMYTYHVTIARGLDPEQPRTISKVTETR
ncbi:MAG: SIS domain-containing protein [Candidatus Limnocylindrales bacterium]